MAKCPLRYFALRFRFTKPLPPEFWQVILSLNSLLDLFGIDNQQDRAN